MVEWNGQHAVLLHDDVCVVSAVGINLLESDSSRQTRRACTHYADVVFHRLSGLNTFSLC